MITDLDWSSSSTSVGLTVPIALCQLLELEFEVRSPGVFRSFGIILGDLPQREYQ